MGCPRPDLPRLPRRYPISGLSNAVALAAVHYGRAEAAVDAAPIVLAAPQPALSGCDQRPSADGRMHRRAACSGGRSTANDRWATVRTYLLEEAFFLPLPRQFRELLSIPLILLGGISELRPSRTPSMRASNSWRRGESPIARSILRSSTYFVTDRAPKDPVLIARRGRVCPLLHRRLVDGAPHARSAQGAADHCGTADRSASRSTVQMGAQCAEVTSARREPIPSAAATRECRAPGA